MIRSIALFVAIVLPQSAEAQEYVASLARLIETSSGATLFGAAFLGGFLSSLTPCVYPLIPVTLSLFGAHADQSLSRRFSLALSYVLGISFSYTSLGLFAASTGSLFGSLLGSPIVIGLISLLLVVLSLFSLDVLQFSVGSKIQNLATQIGGTGYRGAFLMGIVSGIIAAPCIGPVLVAILIVAASMSNPAQGALLLFSYSIGLGLIFLGLGLFSGLLSRIPRSGNWLYASKFLLATATLIVALFFAAPILSELYATLAHLQGILLGTTLLGVILLIASNTLSISWLRFPAATALALAAYLGCIYTGHHSVISPSNQLSGEHSEIVWHSSIEDALKNSNGTVVMVDLYADWCAACKEFDAITFADTSVQQELKKLGLARLDFTAMDDRANEIADQYSILGLPTILFLNPDAREIPDSRITGFLPPEEFLGHVKAIGIK